MQRDEPRVIDAKFKVIRRPRGQRRFWFDWRNFLIVGGLSAAAALRPLLESLQRAHH
jgi:hypothetical protein